METENRDKMESLNVGPKPKTFLIDLNQTPVLSPREGSDDWLSRAAETNISVCSVCRTEVPTHRGAAAEPMHPGWKCLRCLLKNTGSCSSGGGCSMERFDINASPPPEDHDGEVVAMASGNDRSHEASTSFHPFPLLREKVEQKSNRDPCPPGKLLSSKLPSYLMGDTLQVWELALRFSEVLGLGQPFSLQELVSELVSPWQDNYLDSHLGRSTNTISAKVNGSLLKLLVSELLSKLAVFAYPNVDSREPKSRQGKEKSSDWLAALEKTKLGMLPFNGLTWQEIARRYIIALMSMKGDLVPTEIASCVSGKVFRCLHGDGGILCGSFTGITALEADAVVLEEAMSTIFRSLQSEDEIFSVSERESGTDGAQAIAVCNDAIPEWAQVLEPVRKLQANVGARIRKCIYEALERNPPEWAKEKLEHSISKAVYKANASGPTKRAVISVLENVRPNPCLEIEKKEVVKIKRFSELISKQCRVVLRQVVAANEDRVFCTLVGSTILNPSDNDDKGLLGYPAMVSRPLDFRTIDVRLAAGVYGGSHKAFAEDVQEVLRNIRTACGDRSDLVGFVENLSQKFEELYEKEVLGLVNKVAELSNFNGSNDDALKKRDDLLALVVNNPLPRAYWDKGICKVCGMDKDNDKVLLCDKCDSEYHIYCLSPPLLKIPKGFWYCPSCVAGRSIPRGDASGSVAVTQCRKRTKQGEIKNKFLKDMAQLASLLELKEYWEFTVEERLFLMKFLFEEALNSTSIHDHIDQCASQTVELQHKLKPLTSEFKILKFKEEMLVSSTHDPDQANMVSQDNNLKLVTIKKDICDLQDSIASIELELFKVSLRKDFLGRDSNGRVYWAFYSLGTQPWIVANGSLTSQEHSSEEFARTADCDVWMSYDSDNEIEELLGWLRESNVREKELRQSISQFQSSKLKDEYAENHVLSKGGSRGKDLLADFLTTKAMTVLEKRIGLCFQEGKVYRCECLELLWPSKYHCPSCHQSFLTSEQLRQHSMKTCKALETANERNPTEEKENETSVVEMPTAFGLSKSSIINESSLSPLLGKAAQETLRLLKINLLDMDAALPEDALRISRSQQSRRSAWCSFVKSATSIYEMVQATIILEDMMKSEYLHSNWWYWSSPSTAVKITTLCALALRIYTLDSSILYETSESGCVEHLESSCRAINRRKISNS